MGVLLQCIVENIRRVDVIFTSIVKTISLIVEFCTRYKYRMRKKSSMKAIGGFRRGLVAIGDFHDTTEEPVPI